MKLDFEFFSFGEFISGETLKIYTFTFKNDSGSISNNLKITPESFQTNFHIIFALRDPQNLDFELKSNKKFKSMPEICQV